MLYACPKPEGPPLYVPLGPHDVAALKVQAPLTLGYRFRGWLAGARASSRWSAPFSILLALLIPRKDNGEPDKKRKNPCAMRCNQSNGGARIMWHRTTRHMQAP